MSSTLSLYLHVPYCLSKCGYCDFYSEPSAAVEEEYVRALCQGLRQTAEQTAGRTVVSVFFGGGTPSLLDARQMERILRALSEFSLSDDCELSVEVNPATADRQTLRAYRALGINRISIGMQSAKDTELALLGRRHRHADTCRCVEDARAAGFENLSLDLMYGLPCQSVTDFLDSVQAALDLSPEHLSLYALTLSEQVPLYEQRALLPEEDAVRDSYLAACEAVRAAGLFQYEISNFARRGYECRHNLRYWQRGEYLGLGPSASSFYRGRRYTAPACTQAFCKTPCPVQALLCEPALSDADALFETLMLSLRLTAGLELGAFCAALKAPEAFLREAERLSRAGLCTVKDDILRLTQNGFFVSNEIITRLLVAAGL